MNIYSFCLDTNKKQFVNRIIFVDRQNDGRKTSYFDRDVLYDIYCSKPILIKRILLDFYTTI